MARNWVMVAVFGALAVTAGAAEQPQSASYWYAVDHIVKAEEGAQIVVWATLPPDWHGQEVEVTAIDPEPAAILSDARTGNRVVEWVLEPDPAAPPPHTFFHYEITLREIPLHLDIDPEAVGPYAKDAEFYRQYTAPETWIQTDGRVRDRALALIGEETNPWLQARAIYTWLVENVRYEAPGPQERDAEAVLLAGRGDCGQIAVLMTGMLRSVGVPARTVTCAFTDGGTHVLVEFWLEGYGWVPADPSFAQVIDLDFPGFTPEDVERVTAARGMPLGDAGWLLGNLYAGRLVMSVGNNIHFESPTLGRKVTLQRAEPGGVDATPPAFAITGLNRDIVHGGFWVFGDPPADDDEAHALTHQRLAGSFFRVGLFEVVEDECLKSVEKYTGSVQSWINMGKVYLHKGDYYKAEAAFKKAMVETAAQPQEHLEARIWTHNYLGNCYDLMGYRDLAKAEYEAVVEIGNNFRGAVDYARKFLAKAFTKERAERM